MFRAIFPADFPVRSVVKRVFVRPLYTKRRWGVSDVQLRSETTAMTPDNEFDAIDRVVQRLRDQFTSVPTDAISRIVTDCYSRFAECKVRTYVPLLVEHAARDMLHTTTPPSESVPTQVRGTRTSSKFRLAFADGRAWAVL